MDVERLLRIPDADDFRALTILDLLRADIKQTKQCPEDVLKTLLDVLSQKLSRAKRPSEEMVLAVVQVMVELVHVNQDVASAVANALPELVLCHVGKSDRVRRAAGVLLNALVRKGARIASAVIQPLASTGIGSADESVRRAALTLCGELVRSSGHLNLSLPLPEGSVSNGAGPGGGADGVGLDIAPLFDASVACLMDESPAVIACAEKALGRMRTVEGKAFSERVKSMNAARQASVHAHMDAIKQYTLQSGTFVPSKNSSSNSSSGVVSPGGMVGTVGLEAFPVIGRAIVSPNQVCSHVAAGTKGDEGKRGDEGSFYTSPLAATAASLVQNEGEGSKVSHSSSLGTLETLVPLLGREVTAKLAKLASTAVSAAPPLPSGLESDDGKISIEHLAASEAVLSRLTLLASSTATDGGELAPLVHNAQVVFTALLALIRDPSFRVALTGLHSLDHAVRLLGSASGSTLLLCMPHMLSVLTERLGDSKGVIRAAAIKCMGRLSAVLGPSYLLPRVYPLLLYRSRVVRESALRVCVHSLVQAMSGTERDGGRSSSGAAKLTALIDVDFRELLLHVCPLLEPPTSMDLSTLPQALAAPAQSLYHSSVALLGSPTSVEGAPAPGATGGGSSLSARVFATALELCAVLDSVFRRMNPLPRHLTPETVHHMHPQLASMLTSAGLRLNSPEWTAITARLEEGAGLPPARVNGAGYVELGPELPHMSGRLGSPGPGGSVPLSSPTSPLLAARGVQAQAVGLAGSSSGNPDSSVSGNSDLSSRHLMRVGQVGPGVGQRWSGPVSTLHGPRIPGVSQGPVPAVETEGGGTSRPLQAAGGGPTRALLDVEDEKAVIAGRLTAAFATPTPIAPRTATGDVASPAPGPDAADAAAPRAQVKGAGAPRDRTARQAPPSSSPPVPEYRVPPRVANPIELLFSDSPYAMPKATPPGRAGMSSELNAASGGKGGKAGLTHSSMSAPSVTPPHVGQSVATSPLRTVAHVTGTVSTTGDSPGMGTSAGPGQARQQQTALASAGGRVGSGPKSPRAQRQAHAAAHTVSGTRVAGEIESDLDREGKQSAEREAAGTQAQVQEESVAHAALGSEVAPAASAGAAGGVLATPPRGGYAARHAATRIRGGGGGGTGLANTPTAAPSALVSPSKDKDREKPALLLPSSSPLLTRGTGPKLKTAATSDSAAARTTRTQEGASAVDAATGETTAGLGPRILRYHDEPTLGSALGFEPAMEISSKMGATGAPKSDAAVSPAPVRGRTRSRAAVPEPGLVAPADRAEEAVSPMEHMPTGAEEAVAMRTGLELLKKRSRGASRAHARRTTSASAWEGVGTPGGTGNDSIDDREGEETPGMGSLDIPMRSKPAVYSGIATPGRPGLGGAGTSPSSTLQAGPQGAGSIVLRSSASANAVMASTRSKGSPISSIPLSLMPEGQSGSHPHSVSLGTAVGGAFLQYAGSPPPPRTTQPELRQGGSAGHTQSKEEGGRYVAALAFEFGEDPYGSAAPTPEPRRGLHADLGMSRAGMGWPLGLSRATQENSAFGSVDSLTSVGLAWHEEAPDAAQDHLPPLKVALAGSAGAGAGPVARAAVRSRSSVRSSRNARSLRNVAPIVQSSVSTGSGIEMGPGHGSAPSRDDFEGLSLALPADSPRSQASDSSPSVRYPFPFALSSMPSESIYGGEEAERDSAGGGHRQRGASGFTTGTGRDSVLSWTRPWSEREREDGGTEAEPGERSLVFADTSTAVHGAGNALSAKKHALRGLGARNISSGTATTRTGSGNESGTQSRSRLTLGSSSTVDPRDHEHEQHEGDGEGVGSVSMTDAASYDSGDGGSYKQPSPSHPLSLGGHGGGAGYRTGTGYGQQQQDEVDERPIRPLSNAEAFYRTIAAQPHGPPTHVSAAAVYTEHAMSPQVALVPVEGGGTAHGVGNDAGAALFPTSSLSRVRSAARSAGTASPLRTRLPRSPQAHALPSPAEQASSVSVNDGDIWRDRQDSGSVGPSVVGDGDGEGDAYSIGTATDSLGSYNIGTRHGQSGRGGPGTRSGARRSGGITGMPVPSGAGLVDVSALSNASIHSVGSLGSVGSTAGGGGAGTTGMPSGAPNTERLYIPSSALTPMPPTLLEGAIRSALVDLAQTETWDRQFEALTLLRRLVLHHHESITALSSSAFVAAAESAVASARSKENATGGPFTSPFPSSGYTALHAFVCLTLVAADSLRSSLSKAACMALCDMFAVCGRPMDVELDVIAPVLVRRASDTNEFLASAAGVALASMIAHAGEGRLISALLACSSSKTGSIRQGAACWLDRAVDKCAPKLGASKDLERLVNAGARYAQEGLPDARHAGTRILQRLLKAGVIDDKYLAKVVPDRTLSRLRPQLDRPTPEDSAFSSLLAIAASGAVPRAAGAGSALDEGWGGGMPARGRARAVTAAVSLRRAGQISGSNSGGVRHRSSQALVEPEAEEVMENEVEALSLAGTPRKGGGGPLVHRSRSVGPALTGAYSVHAGEGAVYTPTGHGGASMTGDELEAALGLPALSAKDWRVRVDALHGLPAKLQCLNAASLSSVTIRLASELVPRLTDGNVKVAAAAVSIVAPVVRTLRHSGPGDGPDRTTPLLLPALSSALASSNAAVAEGAAAATDALLGVCDPGAVMAPLSSAIRGAGSGRARALLLDRLTHLLPYLAPGTGGAGKVLGPGTLLRTILPSIQSSLEDGKPDVRAAVSGTVRALGGVIGRARVWEAARGATAGQDAVPALQSHPMSEAALEVVRRALGV